MNGSGGPPDPRRLRALARAALSQKRVTEIHIGISTGDADPTPPACRRPGHVPDPNNAWVRLPDGGWWKIVLNPPNGAELGVDGVAKDEEDGSQQPRRSP